MEPQQAPEFNRARLSGRLCNLRQRWTPDGSLALIAELVTTRPKLGPVAAKIQNEQPMPIRAEGKTAKALLAMENQHIMLEGCLRRRYYSRDGNPCWGQVEIWVEACHRLDHSPEQ